MEPVENQEIESATDSKNWKQWLLQGLIQTLNWFRETTFVIVMALGLSILLRTFIFQAFYVPSESMVSTFLRDDRIIASKLSYRFGEINRGDVVVFRDPGGWLSGPVEMQGIAGQINKVLTWVGVLPTNSGEDLVKRVIGLPGDRVACCAKGEGITVNGVAIDESEYVEGDTRTIKFDVIVPAGHIFVMGDNREYSADSRVHLNQNNGAVPIDNVVGQVVALVWPFDRFTQMSGNDPFLKVPEPK
ncbi:MAG: signal peptidase [Actinomycetota bacterium]